jgi:hypothetical protein
MTTQQQQIVDSLIAEFNRINNPRPNGFARIGEALDNCDKWSTLVAEVTASNARYKYLREQIIETDYNRLVEECRLAGLSLRINMRDDCIIIDLEGTYRTDHEITIYYRFDTKMHMSDTRKSIYEVKSIRLHSYQASANSTDDFATIDSLFLYETFFRNWTKLIELSRK